MNRYATLDVGSNSVLLHIADRLEEGRFQPVEDLAAVTRLGEGLHRTGVISDRAAARTIEQLRAYAGIMQASGVEAFAAAGTMCLRTASNARDFIRRAQERTGIPIEVIDGDEEARLSYLAAAPTLPGLGNDIAVFDVGGGSTEFIFGDGSRIVRRFSLDVGAIRFLETHLRTDPPTSEEFADMTRDIETALSSLEPLPRFGVLVGVGGTLVTMAAVMHRLERFDGERVHGTVLDAKEVARQIGLYRSTPLDIRKRLAGVQPGRADVIVAGAAIVRAVMHRLGADRVVVSHRGLRHGLMVDRFGGQARRGDRAIARSVARRRA